METPEQVVAAFNNEIFDEGEDRENNKRNGEETVTQGEQHWYEKVSSYLAYCVDGGLL